jgi:hypothetical protein
MACIVSTTPPDQRHLEGKVKGTAAVFRCQFPTWDESLSLPLFVEQPICSGASKFRPGEKRKREREMGSGTRLERKIAGAPEHLGCSVDDSALERGRRHRGVCCMREGCDCSRLDATQPHSSQPQQIGGRRKRNSAGKAVSISSTDWKEDFRTSVLVLLVLLLGSRAIGMTGLSHRSQHEPRGAGGVVLAEGIVPEPAIKMALLPPPGKANMLQPRDQALRRRHKPRQRTPHHPAAWIFGGFDNVAKAQKMGAATAGQHKKVVRDNGIRVSKLGLAGLATGALFALALQMTVTLRHAHGFEGGFPRLVLRMMCSPSQTTPSMTISDQARGLLSRPVCCASDWSQRRCPK